MAECNALYHCDLCPRNNIPTTDICAATPSNFCVYKLIKKLTLVDNNRKILKVLDPETLMNYTFDSTLCSKKIINKI